MRLSYEEATRHSNTIYENKEKLNKVFKLLRKSGIIARQSFGCCGSCGSYEIATKMEAMLDAGKAVNGYVFYNRQSADAFKGDHWKPADGRLYISYADGTTNKYPNNSPLLGKKIGEMLFIACTEAGLSVEWDGSTDSCVLVKLAEKAVEKITADFETWGE